MTVFIARTCTQLAERESPIGPEDRSLPLEHFRETDAYVLLGSPGSGKTEAFKHEARNNAGCYVTARDFRTFDDRPEWHDTTLYIDGLDETQAGSTDGRAPFDNIRAKIDRLGRPRFRLSCREADWFGANDRDHLKAVSRDGKVTVLRIDPLTDDNVREILRDQFGLEAPNTFIAAAREKGIDPLLANPQSLRMLALALRGGECWPETRIQTFEMACRRLILEHNPDHRAVMRDTVDVSTLMDAAGRLCAIQLLTGSTGYTLSSDEVSEDLPGLEQISGNDRAIFRHVLGTKLFEAPTHGPATPVHRQVAEFLAGRYLHARINEGLPVRRILALITGHDGVVVSELRGLAAWLAAWNCSSRAEIIARDPLGTVLYGDVREFSIQEKTLILDGFRRLAIEDRQFLPTIRTATRLGDLATPEMEETFRACLTDPSRAKDHQFHVFCLITVLRHGQAPPGLVELMPQVVRDGQWYQGIRSDALRVFIREPVQTTATVAELDALLADINAGSIPDPDDELLGALLARLYPVRICEHTVLRYLRAPKNTSLLGNYYAFWTRVVPENSSQEQLAQLLDLLVEQFGRLRPVFVGSPGQINPLRRTPLIWLRRFLEHSQGSLSSDTLFAWLGMASDPELRTSGEDVGFMRRWLGGRPATIKNIVACSAGRCSDSPDFGHCMGMNERLLFSAAWPVDFGSWCLNQALAATDRNAAAWFTERVAISIHYGRQDEGLSRTKVESRLAEDSTLRAAFAKRLSTLEGYESSEAPFARERRTETQRRQPDWWNRVKSNEISLRDNRWPATLLQRLAQVYFNEFVDVQGDTPLDRLRDLLGSDDGLIDTIIESFRGSIRRTDVPTDAEILRLRSQGQVHQLAFPIMAGLEEADRDGAAEDIFLDEREMRLALTIHYATPVPRSASRPSNWFSFLLKSHPALVADVLVQSTRSKIEGGKDFQEDLYDLALSPEHATIARLASVPILETLPARCSDQQLSGMRILLQAALLYSEKPVLLNLIAQKLAYSSMNVGQRVCWLASGFLTAPDTYENTFESYVAETERRVRHLAAFVAGGDFPAALIEQMDARTLSVMVRLIGSSYKPQSPISPNRVQGFIARLSSDPTSAAAQSLQELVSNRNLRPWQSFLADGAYRQNAIRREADFRHCDIERVIEVIEYRRPANAADLAALTVELLSAISRDIRDGNSSDWRKYWNVDAHNRPLAPKPENACRDYLLYDLRLRMMPFGAHIQAEVRYANDKRSDISVSLNDFNIPIEIKRSCHRDLWSAIRSQLIAKYTEEPGAVGYGIYLVFWFGNTEHCRPVSGYGSPPKSASDLASQLRDTLSANEKLRISICVIDVSNRLA